MWKSRPDDKPAAPNSPPASPFAASPALPAPSAGAAAAPPRPLATKAAESFRNEVAHIGSSVIIKGELSGSEDLYLDGEVEGNVDLRQHSLTVGPHGKVRANLHAREIIVHGKVDGNVTGDERVELKKSAVLVGDVHTQRIMIEDGAFFKGAIDLQKEAGSHSEERRDPRNLGATVGSSASSFSGYASALLEKKS